MADEEYYDEASDPNSPNFEGWEWSHSERKFIPHAERVRSLVYEAMLEFSDDGELTNDDLDLIDEWIDEPEADAVPTPTVLQSEVVNFIERVANADADIKESLQPLLSKLVNKDGELDATVEDIAKARNEHIEALASELDGLSPSDKRFNEVRKELDAVSPPVSTGESERYVP